MFVRFYSLERPSKQFKSNELSNFKPIKVKSVRINCTGVSGTQTGSSAIVVNCITISQSVTRIDTVNGNEEKRTDIKSFT